MLKNNFSDQIGENAIFFNEAIAKRLKSISELNGINYCRWALKAGVSPTLIYDLIKGKSNEIKLTTLKKLCDVLHISLPEFFDVDYILNSKLREDDWICGKV